MPFNGDEGRITITNDATRNMYKIVVFENEKIILRKKLAPCEKVFIKSNSKKDYRLRTFRITNNPEYTICKDCKMLPRDKHQRAILTYTSNFHIVTKDPRP